MVERGDTEWRGRVASPEEAARDTSLREQAHYDHGGVHIGCVTPRDIRSETAFGRRKAGAVPVVGLHPIDLWIVHGAPIMAVN